MDVNRYWQVTLAQDAEAMRSYFASDAQIHFHNTNELFTADEFVRMNCLYPGNWAGHITICHQFDQTIITATQVYSTDGRLSYHVTSFFTLEEDKIIALDKYWGEDGQIPDWRQQMRIGKPIK